jgi:hypothetical protein
LGVLLGCTSRASALLLVLVCLAGAGLISALPGEIWSGLAQTAAAAFLVQMGYVGGVTMRGLAEAIFVPPQVNSPRS